MAIWYRTGTVSVTNGSATVTGAGTAWVANVNAGDAIHLPDDRTYEVASVNGDTSITLSANYLGTTQSAQVYKIQPTRAMSVQLVTDVQALIASFQSVADNAGAGKFAAGTVSAPSVRGVADQDSGINFAGGNVVQLVSGGAEVGRFNATGIGIGETTPAAGVHVRKDVTAALGGAVIIENKTATSVGTEASLFLAPNAGGGSVRAASVRSRQATSGNYADMGLFVCNGSTPFEAVTITTGGFVGIGVTPANDLHISSTSPAIRLEDTDGSASIYAEVYSNQQGDLVFDADPGNAAASSTMQFNVDGSECFRVNQTYISIGKTSAATGTIGVSLSKNGAQNTIVSDVASGAQVYMNMQNYASGTVYFFGLRIENVTKGSISYNGTNVVYSTTSDERAKTNIKPAASASDFFDAVNVVQFDWRDVDRHQEFGLIAQDMLKLAPEIVSEGESADDMMGVDYGALVPRLIQEVKALRSRMGLLEAA